LIVFARNGADTRFGYLGGFGHFFDNQLRVGQNEAIGSHWCKVITPRSANAMANQKWELESLVGYAS